MEKMKERYNHEQATQLNKEISDTIRDELKDDKLIFKRYKIMVHCIIGEKKGQGIKIGCKCMCDTTCDEAVSASVSGRIRWRPRWNTSPYAARSRLP